MAVEVGEAYVSIIPSAKGFASNLSGAIGGDLDSVGTDAGERVGGSFVASLGGQLAAGTKLFAVGVAAAGAAVGVAAVGAGVGLFKIGESFDSAFDKIRVTTGKTGDDLSGLQTSFKNVFANVPTDAGSAASAVSTLSQKLGLTGAPLENLSTQLLDLSHITGTDLQSNISGVVDVFNSFGVTAGEQPQKLDELFRANQATGVGVGDLAATMANAGPNLTQLGLNFEQSAALVAIFGKAGVDVSAVLPALSKTIASAAKDGKNAGDVFRETFDRIKNAPSDTEAAGAAIDTFGARAGPKLAGLIRQGKLSYDDLAQSIAAGGDTITQATADTADFSEKWGVFKNKILVGLEPLATSVFDGVGKAMDKLAPIAGPIIAKISDGFTGAVTRISDAFQAGGLKGAIDQVGEEFGRLWDVVSPKLGELLGKIWAWIASTAISLKDKFVTEWAPALGNWIQESALPALLNQLPLIVAAIIGWLQANLPQIQAAWKTAADAFWNWIQSDALPGLQAHLPLIIAALTQWAVDNIPQWGLQLTVLFAEALGLVAIVLLDLIGRMVFSIPPKLVELGLAMLGGLVVGLVAGLSPVLDFFASLPGKVIGLVKSLFGIGSPSTVFAEIGSDIMAGLLSGLLGAVGNVVSFFANLPGQILGWLGSLGGLLVGHGVDLVTGLVIGLFSVVGQVASFFGNLPGQILGWLGSLGGLLVGHGQQAIQGLISGASSLLGSVASLFGSLGGQIVGWVGNLGGILVGAGVSVIQGFISGISSMLGSISGALSSIPGIVSGAVGGLGSLLYSAGASVVSGFVDGIRGAIGSAASAAASLASSVKNAAFSALGIGSPSKVFRAIGVNVGEGFVLGINDSRGMVGGAVNGLFGTPLGMTVGVAAAAGAGGRQFATMGASAGPAGNSFGDINIYAQTNASSTDISRELSWTMLTAGR